MRYSKYLLIIFLSASCIDAGAQSLTDLCPYLLDSFVEGKLYYKEKPPREAKFNYHLVGQEIVMDFNGKKVPVNNFPNLDSVRVGSHNFVLIEGRSYELLLRGEVDLLLDYRYTSQQEAVEGLYGTKSHTQGVVVANKTLKPNDFYSLKWNKGYELVNRSDFYIFQDGKLSKFGNVKQLTQIFKNKKKLIKDFASQNNTDFHKADDVTQIVRFIMDS